MEGGLRRPLPLLVPSLPPLLPLPSPPPCPFLLNSLQTSRIFMCAGGKAPLPVKLPPEPGPRAELREQRNAEGQGGGHAGSKLEGKAFTFLPQPPWGPVTAAMTGKERRCLSSWGGLSRRSPSAHPPASVLPGILLRKDLNYPLRTSSFLLGPSLGTVFMSLSPLKRTSVAASHGLLFPFVAL